MSEQKGLFEAGGGGSAGTSENIAGDERSLKAEILGVRYYDEDAMFGVFSARDMESGVERTLVGKLPKLLPGEVVSGTVKSEDRYNSWSGETERQWKVVSSMRPAPPASETAIRTFLASGFAWKVADNVAGALVSKYGMRTLETLEGIESRLETYLSGIGAPSTGDTESSELGERMRALASGRTTRNLFSPLTSVPGIGPKTAASLMAGWVVNRARHETMLFLFDCGLSSALAERVVGKLGLSAPDIIAENPYRLLGIIPSMPFSAAERMAKRCGIEPLDPRRLEALVMHVLSSLTESAGHVCLPLSVLASKTVEFSGKTGSPVGASDAERTVVSLVESGKIVLQESNGTKYAYSKKLFFSESAVAKSVASLMAYGNRSGLTPARIEPYMKEWEKRNGIALDESQKEALFRSLSSRVSLLVGGPGTGKTTLVKCATHVLDRNGLTYAQCAPTGKAARNMSPDAMTIHRLLGLQHDGGGYGEPVEADWLLSDETSMEDIHLAASKLSAAVRGRANVLMLGDDAQLPSVGAGAVLRSMLDSGEIPVSRLSVVHRTGKGSVLDFLAFAREYEGDGRPLSEFGTPRRLAPGMSFPSGRDGDELREDVLKMVRHLTSKGAGPNDFIVLAPMKKGPAGVFSLNTELRKILNPNAGKPGELERLVGGEKVAWAVGDRVMNTMNDYDNMVFNGETGFVRHVLKPEKSIVVEWPELGKTVTYSKGGLDKLIHAWAVTIHKSQGSEYGTVIVVMPRGAWHMGERALIYTAASRAKKNCILMGDERTFDKSISTVSANRRYSLLAERIRGEDLDPTPDARCVADASATRLGEPEF